MYKIEILQMKLILNQSPVSPPIYVQKVCPKNISQNLLNLEMTFHVLNLLAVSLDIPNLFQPKSRGAAQAKTTIQQ